MLINRLYNSNSIFKSTIIVSFIVILGKMFGFARDAVIAAFYGASWQTDAFFFAQSMPSMIFPAVCNSLSTAFVSLYISQSIEKGEKSGDRFASRSLIATILLAIVLSVLSIIFTPWIVRLFAPGFSLNQTLLSIRLTRLTMSAFVLTMMHYMFSAILNSKKIFYSSQIAALGYNLTVIIITVSLGENQGVQMLTLTVIFGHIIQVIMLIGFIRKRFNFTLKLTPIHEDTNLLIKLAFPILLGNSLVQFNNIIDKVLASFLGNGALSSLSYSNSLNRFVIGIFISTISTVIYPSLTSSFSNKNYNQFNKEVINSLIILPTIITPISIITAILSTDIVRIVYERGSFDSNATALTSSALMFYSLMYIFSSIQEVIIRVFYAMKDSKTPMLSGAVAVFLNSLFSLILVRSLGIGGIALGTTISTAIAAIILFFKLNRILPELNKNKVLMAVWKVILSSLIMSVLVIILRHQLDFMPPLIRFVMITVVGFLVYFGILIILKFEEIIYIVKKLKSAFL